MKRINGVGEQITFGSKHAIDKVNYKLTFGLIMFLEILLEKLNFSFRLVGI